MNERGNEISCFQDIMELFTVLLFPVSRLFPVN